MLDVYLKHLEQNNDCNYSMRVKITWNAHMRPYADIWFCRRHWIKKKNEDKPNSMVWIEAETCNEICV